MRLDHRFLAQRFTIPPKKRGGYIFLIASIRGRAIVDDEHHLNSRTLRFQGPHEIVDVRRGGLSQKTKGGMGQGGVESSWKVTRTKSPGADTIFIRKRAQLAFERVWSQRRAIRRFQGGSENYGL